MACRRSSTSSGRLRARPPGASPFGRAGRGASSGSLFLPGLFWFLLAKDWALATFGTRIGDSIYLPRAVVLVIGGPMAAGYALLMIGASRVLFGAASQSRTALASIGRTDPGMIVVALIFAIAHAQPRE